MEADSAPWRPRRELYVGLLKLAHSAQFLEWTLGEVLCDVHLEAADLALRLEWLRVVLVKAQGFLLERAAKLDADDRAAHGAGR
jgi:hypothetical protein